MKFLKIAFFTVGTFLAVTVLGLFLGSADMSHYDDLGLLDQVMDVPSSMNGYSEVAFTQEEDFELFADGENGDILKQHVYHETWDPTFADTAIFDTAMYVDSAIASTRYSYFKFPTTNGVDELPNYPHVIDLARLMIVKSMHHARNGELTEAIEQAKYATLLSQKVKTESNHWLISHMIGLTMQYETLVWVNHLSIDYDLSQDQRRLILSIFDTVPSYHEDSFSQIFAGEFVFASNMVDMIQQTPISERWQQYWSQEDWWNIELNDDFSLGERNAQESTLDFMQTLFPKYYLHKNRTLNRIAKRYSELSSQALNYCNSIELPRADDAEVKWIDLVKPNAKAAQWADDASIFEQYYTRRCFGHALVDGVKAVAAINSYISDFGELPESLRALVPEYLSRIPIDPFTGAELNYSPEKGYVYSVGANFEDNGGSEDSYYIHHCQQNERCANNPTFPVHFSLPVGDMYYSEYEGCEDE